MKIVIAGAGIGGMVAAAELGRMGFSVTVYEQAESLDQMRYDWHDDVNPDIFKRLGIPVPKEHFNKKSWTFVSPFCAVTREFHQDESHPDLSIERRPLNQVLYDRAAAHATFVFGARVTGALLAPGRVAGIIVNGEKIAADLVIDSLGVDSVLKKSLPASFAITRHREDEVFTVYRGFHRKNPAAPAPRYTNKVYLKHLGECGISWAIQDHDFNLVDVLIGRLGGMDRRTLDHALADLKRTDPTIGDEVVRGGILCRIPVRYPAVRMVANGYAAVGDSAYMTIPMLGSGIASGMLAASFLARTIRDAQRRGITGAALFDAANLWPYQVQVYREFGAEHCGIDVLKRGVLQLDNEILSWMLGSDLLTNDEIGKLAGGGLLTVGPKEAVRKLRIAGISKVGVLLRVNNLLQKSLAACEIAKLIPRTYDLKKIERWSALLEKFYT